jgi:steroid 5-alpha reductase family enzyme
VVDEPSQSGGWSRVDSFGWVGFGYVVAVAAWLWCLAGATAPLAALFVAFVVSMLVIYAFSIAFDNGSFFDAYWSVIPPLVALHWIGHAADAVTMRQIVVVVLVFAWGIRLTWNWARGWTGLEHEDWRYIDLYQRSPLPKAVTSLVGIHFFPMLQVFLGCLALMPALAYGARPFGAIDAVAVIVTAGAILVETVADEQMRAFARTKQSGDIMQSGLWAYSRHPNYFGELGFWWGLFLFALAADPGSWWTGVGALAMSLMFHFASVPMLDQRSLERRPAYAEHMRRVNAVIPGRRRD